ncbi:MAG TPA: helix-turn-helix domain-containing protein [Firmicutes bacterium]|nr:helix-turn-helix domain-containing protein [Bacillota bacterium]
MEDRQPLNLIIAANIAANRRRMGMTQLELAEKIDYSDKSVSKWERGEAAPDLHTLVRLAEIFGVTVNDLVYAGPTAASAGNAEEEKARPNAGRKRIIITLMSVVLVWFIDGIICFSFGVAAPDIFAEWAVRVLLYALPVSFIVWHVFACLWWPPVWRAVASSGIAWSAAVCVHVTFYGVPWIGLAYAVAGVAQVLIVLWHFFRRSSRR